MKMRKFTALITSLCLASVLLCQALHCQAAELNAFLTTHEVVTTDTGSQLLVYGSKLPENGNLTVSIDSQTLPDAQLSTVRQEKLPVTIYCLVDISSHMSNLQIQEQTDILNIISSRMGEGDTMVISTVGSKLIEGALLETLEARKTAISTLKREGSKADMYSAIATAMTTLEQKTSYNANRCLLILSDGILDSGSTGNQRALDAITATTIPVYALGITGGSDDSYFIKNANQMLELAEASRNGFGLIPASENMSAAAGAQELWEHIQESSVIRIDLAQVTTGSNNAVLRAQYQVGDTKLEDSVTVDLTKATVSVGNTVPHETEETLVPEETPEPETLPELHRIWPLVIGSGVLVVALIVIAFLVSKKRKKSGMTVEAVSDTTPVVESILSTGDLGGDGSQAQNYTKTAPIQDVVAIRFSMVEHENVAVSFSLQPHNQQILGRDDRADIILNAEDYQLSGRHCLLEWDGSYLYIQDMGSTNGTILDGMILKRDTWSRLNNGSTLHMGSFDYQVTIHL